MSLIMPALSLGIYNGCKAVAEGRKAGPDILLSGFRQNLPELIKIGGIYFLAPSRCSGSAVLIDGGMGDLMLLLGKADAGETLEDPSFGLALLVGTLGSTPLMMAYWFAPLLAGWGRSGRQGAVLQLRRLLRNWRAFLAYGWA
jgi:hypothetical protein